MSGMRGGSRTRVSGGDVSAQREENATAPRIPHLLRRIGELFAPHRGTLVLTAILVIIGAARRIMEDPELAAVRVVILTTFGLDEYVFEAIRGGASGFLVKDTEPEELIHTVRVVAAGDALLSPAITRRLIEEFAAHAREPSVTGDLDRLTDREREVMALAAEGLSNDEIAARLGVSPATAKTHVSRAMVKLGARDRAQLVVMAYESGLIRPGWQG